MLRTSRTAEPWRAKVQRPSPQRSNRPLRCPLLTRTGRSSEVVLESEHHLARPDLGAGDLTERRRAEARIRICEHRMIEDVLGLDAQLDPLIGANRDVF